MSYVAECKKQVSQCIARGQYDEAAKLGREGLEVAGQTNVRDFAELRDFILSIEIPEERSWLAGVREFLAALNALRGAERYLVSGVGAGLCSLGAVSMAGSHWLVFIASALGAVSLAHVLWGAWGIAQQRRAEMNDEAETTRTGREVTP